MRSFRSSQTVALLIMMGFLQAGCASSSFAGEPADSSVLPEYGVGGRGVQEDRGEQYQSVVMVLFPDSSFCSGVLITPRHVLTAAHCFCLPLGFEAREGTHVYDGSACTRTATVISPSRRSLTNGNKLPSSRGKAVIHEDFRATVLDGRIGKQIADLAVIQLEEPLGDINPDGNMPEVDVSYHERLTIVGMGPPHTGGATPGFAALAPTSSRPSTPPRR